MLTPHPKWRFIVPVMVLVLAAGGLVLSSRFKTPSTFQVNASVTETVPRTASQATVMPDKGVRTTTLSLDMMKEREQYHTQQRQWMFQAGFSLLMALASVYIILSKRYPDDVNKWGYSTIAFIMGYWLKG